MNTKLSKWISQLNALLNELSTLQEQLIELCNTKLEAIRRADTNQMLELDNKQQALLSQVQQRDGLRRQIMDAVGVTLGMKANEGRTLTITELHSRLPSDPGGTFLETATRLRDIVARLARINGILQGVTQRVHSHLQSIAAALRPIPISSSVYSDDGRTIGSVDNLIWETIG